MVQTNRNLIDLPQLTVLVLEYWSGKVKKLDIGAQKALRLII